MPPGADLPVLQEVREWSDTNESCLALFCVIGVGIVFGGRVFTL